MLEKIDRLIQRLLLCERNGWETEPVRGELIQALAQAERDPAEREMARRVRQTLVDARKIPPVTAADVPDAEPEPKRDFTSFQTDPGGVTPERETEELEPQEDVGEAVAEAGAIGRDRCGAAQGTGQRAPNQTPIGVEQAILHDLAAGMSKAEAARRYGVSRRTVIRIDKRAAVAEMT